MADDPDVIESLSDAPLQREAVKEIDGAEGIRKAIGVAIKRPPDGSDLEAYTDDVLVVTDDHVRYLSRYPGEGWSIDREDPYEGDESLKATIEELYDHALENAERKVDMVDDAGR